MTQEKTPYIATAKSTNTEAGGSLFPDWREILVIIVERLWIGVVVALLTFFYIWYSTYRETPLYRSTATIMVETTTPHLMDFTDVRMMGVRSLEYFNTHLKAMHSRRMMGMALANSGLDEHPDLFPGASPELDRAEAALRFVHIAPVERSRLINITAEHHNPQIAADLANALAEAYIQQDFDNRMEASMQAVEWLRDRAEEYRERLEVGLLGLQQYREETQSVSLEEDQNIVIDKLKSLNNALTAAQTDRISAETEWSALKRQLEADLPLTDIPIVIEREPAREAFRTWRSQRRNTETVRQRYLPGHPDYQAAVEEEARTFRQFEEAAQRVVDTVQGRYEQMVERERSLRAALEEQEQVAFELDRKLVQYNDLRRRVDAEDKVYQAIISRMQEASLTGSLPSDLIRVVQEARSARSPFHPNRQRAITRGASLGAMFGLIAIFALYFADHRLRRNEEVERTLNLPVLGTLPLISKGSLRERGLATHLEDTGEVAESFRSLRASLMMDPSKREDKIMMITSTNAGEGKSLVATNLAICLAQDGQKTLLIGADLRRPSLHKLFEVENSVGLSDYLNGERRWSNCLIESGVPRLDVMPAGKLPSRPADLLSGSAWNQMLKSTAEQYDRVIIDAPPLLGISDSLVILSHIDTVLFVVRYGMTHSLSARHALHKLEASGTPCAGVIMNGVNLHSIANYYYYRRYGGYGYEYSAKPARAAGPFPRRMAR